MLPGKSNGSQAISGKEPSFRLRSVCIVLIIAILPEGMARAAETKIQSLLEIGMHEPQEFKRITGKRNGRILHDHQNAFNMLEHFQMLQTGDNSHQIG